MGCIRCRVPAPSPVLSLDNGERQEEGGNEELRRSTKKGADRKKGERRENDG